MDEILATSCPPRCPKHPDGAHVFDQWAVLEWHEEMYSELHRCVLPRRPAMESAVCECGYSAFDECMMSGGE